MLMSDDQFSKLFKYVEEFRGDVDKKFEKVNLEFSDVRGAIGELGAQIRDYHNEVAFLSHNFNRLRAATLLIAKKVHVKLSPDL